MCGVAGIWDLKRAIPADALKEMAGRMADTLAHRGPDAGAVWVDAESGVALGHRRLSILDLSPTGAQPMISADGRWVICYNGEGYNAVDLGSELQAQGLCLKGHSDTEILLETIARWGVEEAVSRFNGMFAFALWDRRDRQLFLCRDRLGIKPLYWAKIGEQIIFGSEMKALRADGRWQPEVDRNAVSAFLRHNYIPAPHTIYRGVRKLLPGHLLRIDADGRVEDRIYWDFDAVVREGMAARRPQSEDQAADRLDALLKDAVQRQMVSDVPLGAFLSGGIDSSTVCAMMCAREGARVRTFSIGFAEADYNEAPHAAAIAAHLGTEHTEFVLQPHDAMAVVPDLATWWDEPFSDSSQIPTLILSQLTRGSVTVALSGDGGDELFAGYNRYFWPDRLEPYLKNLTGLGRHGLAAFLRRVPPGFWDGLARAMPHRWRPAQAGDKARKLADVLALGRPGLYRRLVSHWMEPDDIVLGGQEPHGILWDDELQGRFANAVEWMQRVDTTTYLPDDILTKVDRAGMAVSLETRVPMLDHRLVEFAWTLPMDMKVRNGGGKWLLRQVLARYVPPALFERPKMGFGLPVGEWLRGPLRDWAESLLDERRLRDGGLVAPEPVRRHWQEHLSGNRNWQYLLWDVLMLEAWREKWLNG